MVKFNCGKSLYMKGWPVFFNFFNKGSPIMKVISRMYASDDMNFSNSFIVKTFHNIKHLFMTIFPAFRITFWFMIRAEPAIINALISWFNMKIAVKVCKIAIVSSSDDPGKQAKKSQIGIFKKEQTIFRGYTGITVYLISYHPEVFIVYMVYEVG